jgi:hypothetical protein
MLKACDASGMSRAWLPTMAYLEGESIRNKHPQRKPPGKKQASTGKSGEVRKSAENSRRILVASRSGKTAAVGLAAATGDALLAGVTLGVRPAALAGAVTSRKKEKPIPLPQALEIVASVRGHVTVRG